MTDLTGEMQWSNRVVICLHQELIPAVLHECFKDPAGAYMYPFVSVDDVLVTPLSGATSTSSNQQQHLTELQEYRQQQRNGRQWRPPCSFATQAPAPARVQRAGRG